MALREAVSGQNEATDGKWLPSQLYFGIGIATPSGGGVGAYCESKPGDIGL